MFDLSKTLVEILADLISVKSETGSEKELCDKLFLTLEKYDGELIRVKNSLLFSTKFTCDKRVALVGHIDTVPIAKSSTDPVQKDGFLWGRGACDMKSGLAVMLKIIHEISTGIIAPKNNISFIFYENEEGALPNGINFLLDEKALKDIDFAYILEPTEGKYSVGCLGALSLKKSIYGISAHSANPKKGKNAIDEALLIYNSISEMNSKINRTQNIEDLEYYETVNITTFETTNKAFNVIPAQVDMSINYRFSPNKNLAEAKDELLKYLGEDNIEILDSADSCFIGNSGDEFLLPGVEREIMQAWTDIAQLNNNGIPAINFGAGSILHAHKPDERISIDDLNSFYKLMIKHL